MNWYRDISIALRKAIKGAILRKYNSENEDSFLQRCSDSKKVALEDVSEIEKLVNKEHRDLKRSRHNYETPQEMVEFSQRDEELKKFKKAIKSFFESAKCNDRIICIPDLPYSTTKFKVTDLKSANDEIEMASLTEANIHKHLDKNIFKLFGRNRCVVFGGELRFFREKKGYQHIETLLRTPKEQYNPVKIYFDWLQNNMEAPDDDVDYSKYLDEKKTLFDFFNIGIENNSIARRRIAELIKSTTTIMDDISKGDYTEEKIERLESEEEELKVLNDRSHVLKKAYDCVVKRIEDAKDSFITFRPFYDHLFKSLAKNVYDSSRYKQYCYDPKESIQWYT